MAMEAHEQLFRSLTAADVARPDPRRRCSTAKRKFDQMDVAITPILITPPHPTANNPEPLIAQDLNGELRNLRELLRQKDQAIHLLQQQLIQDVSKTQALNKKLAEAVQETELDEAKFQHQIKQMAMTLRGYHEGYHKAKRAFSSIH